MLIDEAFCASTERSPGQEPVSWEKAWREPCSVNPFTTRNSAPSIASAKASVPIATGRSSGFGGSRLSSAPQRPRNSFLPTSPASSPATMLTGLKINLLTPLPYPLVEADQTGLSLRWAQAAARPSKTDRTWGMATQTHSSLGALADDATPDEERPLKGYATLTATFAGLAASFSIWVRRSGRELPERIDARDLALITVATHKASRMLAKDRVTSAVRAPFTRLQADGSRGKVEERPRGSGLRRALGELLLCPFCLSVWIGFAFAAGLVVAPRPTRWTASVLTTVFGSDVLQVAYKRLEDTL